MVLMKAGLLFSLLLITSVAAYPEADPGDESYYDGEYEENPEETVDYGEVPEFDVAPQHLEAREKESIRIPCKLTHDSEYVLIISKAPATPADKEEFLFVGEVRVPFSRRYKLDNNYMEISNLRPSDSGTYICKLQVQDPVMIEHHLNVLYAPRLKETSEAEQRVVKGATVDLSCAADGNPEPTITWTREEGHLPSGAQHEEGMSITLEEVNRHEEGTYTCTASNGVGQPVSATMTITVEYPPEILTEKAIVRTGEGDTVELVCIVHARPTAIVSWTKDGMHVAPDQHLQESDGGHRHYLRISHVSENDFGVYTCRAVNDNGEANASIHITAVPKPPVVSSDPNGGEETSYTLTWDTESFYPITTFRLMYRKAKANDSTDIPGDWEEIEEAVQESEEGGMEDGSLHHSLKHTLEQLEPATDYHAAIQVKNTITWSANTEFAFSTKKEKVAKTTSRGCLRVESSHLLTLLMLLPVLLIFRFS